MFFLTEEGMQNGRQESPSLLVKVFLISGRHERQNHTGLLLSSALSLLTTGHHLCSPFQYTMTRWTNCSNIAKPNNWERNSALWALMKKEDWGMCINLVKQITRKKKSFFPYLVIFFPIWSFFLIWSCMKSSDPSAEKGFGRDKFHNTLYIHSLSAPSIKFWLVF